MCVSFTQIRYRSSIYCLLKLGVETKETYTKIDNTVYRRVALFYELTKLKWLEWVKREISNKIGIYTVESYGILQRLWDQTKGFHEL